MSYVKAHIIDNGIYVGESLIGLPKFISLHRRGCVKRTKHGYNVVLNK